MNTVSVKTLVCGSLTAPAAFWRQGADPDQLHEIPVLVHLIEHPAGLVLVDCGLHPDSVADPSGYYNPLVGATRFAQERSVADQVPLDELRYLVLSHLHYDHAGALALVPDEVPLVIQRNEWEAGHDEQAIARNYLCPRDYADQNRELILVDGDHDLFADGTVELLLTPGHTPGHQSVRAGDLLLTVDVAHFTPTLDDERFPPFGDSHTNQRASAQRLRALRDEQGLRVQPGHELEGWTPGGR
jgi:N-acyl homoserine lactone hydrolase